MENYGVVLFMAAVVGVWILFDWWREERHRPFPDDED